MSLVTYLLNPRQLTPAFLAQPFVPALEHKHPCAELDVAVEKWPVVEKGMTNGVQFVTGSSQPR